MAIYPNSNLPTASQPWGRAIQAKVELVDAQFLKERTNNTARDAQLQASYVRLDATSIQTAAAVVAAQDAIDAITGVTTNIYVPGTTNINGGTIQTGTISASSISAGTLTGFTVQTAASGARVILNGSANSLQFTNSSGTIVTNIFPGDSVGGDPSLFITYGAAKDTSASNMIKLADGSFLLKGGSGNSGKITGQASYLQLQTTGSDDLIEIQTTSPTGRILLSTTNITAAGPIKYTGYASGLGTGTALILGSSATGYTIGIAASSRRFKENIEPIEDISYLDKISALTPVTFNYKENPTQPSFGLIAEDVNAVGLTGIVHNDLDENGNLVPFSLMYDRLAVYMIPAIKELNERIKLLEGK